MFLFPHEEVICVTCGEVKEDKGDGKKGREAYEEACGCCSVTIFCVLV